MTAYFTLVRKIDPVNMNNKGKKFSGKWKPVILCILLNRPERFNKLRQLLLDVNPNTLTRSIKQLEASGMLVKVGAKYKLTQPAKRIAELLMEIMKIVDDMV